MLAFVLLTPLLPAALPPPEAPIEFARHWRRLKTSLPVSTTHSAMFDMNNWWDAP